MGANILVIEDSEDFRELLRMTLEFKGHTVRCAADGAEGLEAAREETFDLIISDLEMPILSGVEFVRRFRAASKEPTPVIVLSAANDELVHQALAAGASGYVAKPFEPIELLKEIEKYLGDTPS